MIFKERGLTIGDLIILLIVVLLSFFIINKTKDSKTQKKVNNLYQLKYQKILVTKYF